MSTGRESDKFMLRLPDGMRDQIKAAAERNKRSMNAEIVIALDDWLHQLERLAAEAPFQREMSELAEQDRKQASRNLPEVSVRVNGVLFDYVPHPRYLKQDD